MKSIQYVILDCKEDVIIRFKSTSALKRHITSETGGNGRRMCKWIKRTIYGGEKNLKFKDRFIIIEYTIKQINKYENRKH